MLIVALNNDEIAEPNTFAIGAACAAFNYGHNWNLELREYIEKNKEYVIQSLKLLRLTLLSKMLPI